jgi:hypothetical protein
MIFTFSGIYASAAQRAQCTVPENPESASVQQRRRGKRSRADPLSFKQLTEAHLIQPNLERAPLETIEP